MRGDQQSDNEVANVSRFLDRMAAAQANQAALLIPRGRSIEGEIDYLSLSFSELAAEQDTWARRFLGAGMGEGSRVLIMVKPGLPLIAICFALFKIGAVPIVIDPGMGLKSFLKCVERSAPEFLVGISLALWVSRIFRKPFALLKAKIKVGGRLDRVALPGEAIDIQPANTKRDDLAAVLFTSGSTGAPKGVCYEHGMFEGQVEAIRDQYGIQSGEVDLPMLPIFALFNPGLGMTTVVPEINPSKPATVDPAKIAQAIRQCQVTNSFGSPALWKKIGAYCEREKVTLPSLRRILVAGASAPPTLMAQFRKILSPEAHMHSPYGATEVLPVSSVSDNEILDFAADLTEKGAGTCVGGLLPKVEARILAPKEGAMEADDLKDALPGGQIGEIVVTGPTVTKAYDRLPGPTKVAKIDDGGRIWHRMGDLGYFDERGRLWFCGRKAERVESSQGLFYTDACEGVFNRHPKVNRCALILYEKGGASEPALVVEPFKAALPKNEKERSVFIDELLEIGQQVEATRTIKQFFFDRSFPVDVRHNAKIHRLTLRKRYGG